MSNLENAKRIIGARVELFARNRAQYHAPEYKEAQLRREFLDPFFEALGWDVANKQGWAEQYKVVNEDARKIAGAPQAPDYAFRIGGARKFFAAAKKPALTLKSDATAAYQLRRCAWSAQLPLAILSNFEELAVYDCRARPSENDSARVGRVNFFTYDQYLERLPEIYAVFSKEAVLRGSLERYAREQPARGAAPVGAEFSKELEGWRVTLARDLARLNPHLGLDELNDAAQRTLDRIIFLRLAEDRGVEEYGRLRRIAAPLEPAAAELRALAPDQVVKLGALTRERGGVYARFISLCRDADAKYNSGLFDFDADQLTPALSVDDDKLRRLIADLYYPRAPYEFSVLAADTLGNVCEQFLGKRLRLTPAHQVKIEEKPAVKKAGGVFSAPTYIVEYIVRQTVGKMIGGKSPLDIATLRVVDPACGAGAFLLGAYQCLLDHCLNWYVAHRDDKQSKGKIYASAQGWRLTPAEKKRILTTHIFGVDIDRQAVEVTKLLLLLKGLEGETRETLDKQLAFLTEPALPKLEANIKCGNALIGTDDLAEQWLSDADELRRVNPFDWAREFPEVFGCRDPERAAEQQGFDVVMGNPPAVRIHTMQEGAPREAAMYKEKYVVARAGNYALYGVFVERGLSLLKPGGRLGFVLPHKFFNAQYGAPLRELISRGKHLAHIVHFGEQQVFPGVRTYTCLMFLDKRGADACQFLKVDDLDAWRTNGQAIQGVIPAQKITRAEWNFVVGAGAALFDKLAAMPVKLGDVANIFAGLQTSADDVFILEFVAETPRTLRMRSKALDAEWTFEKDLLFWSVSGTEVNRYEHLPERQYILLPYSVQNKSARLIAWKTIADKYPRIAAYLHENKKALERREQGKFKGREWYRFGRNPNIEIQQRAKLCVPRLAERLGAAYDVKGNYFLAHDVNGITLTPEYSELGSLYLLGLLNSSLLRWYFSFASPPLRGGRRFASRQFLASLPIRPINFDDAHDIVRYRRVIALVEQMLELHKQRAEARPAADRELIQRQIDATDAQIDAAVYALYELTEGEIQIVEGQ